MQTKPFRDYALSDGARRERLDAARLQVSCHWRSPTVIRICRDEERLPVPPARRTGLIVPGCAAVLVVASEGSDGLAPEPPAGRLAWL
jgi:hypothetical protein